MNNFGISFKYSVINKFNKPFAIISLIIFVLIFAIGNLLPVLITNWSEEQSSEENATQIYFYSENKEYSEALSTQLNENVEQNIISSAVDSFDNSVFDKENENAQYLINLDTSQVKGTEELDYEGEALFKGLMNSIQVSSYANELQAKYNVSEEDITKLNSLGQYEFEKVSIYDEGEETQSDDSQGVYYAINILSAIATYIFVMIGLQLVGNEVLEEKTSRAMEIIVTSTDVISHLFAKVLATFLYIVSFILVIVLSIVVTFGFVYFVQDIGDFFAPLFDIAKEFLAIDSASTFTMYLILIILLLTISLVFFMLASGILASVTSSAEEYSKIISPLMILLIAPYVLAFLPFISAEVLKIVAFLPGIAIFVVPNLYVQQEIGVLFVVFAIVAQIAYLVLLSTIGLKVYRAGVLNYSDRSFRKILFDVLKSR